MNWKRELDWKNETMLLSKSHERDCLRKCHRKNRGGYLNK